MKHFVAAALMVTAAGAAVAQTPAAPAIPNPPPMNMAPGEGPVTPPPAPQGGTVLAMLGLVAAIMTHDHRHALVGARALLARHGARVVVAAPGDTPARLLAARRAA